jgi:hypothetical protein
MEIGNTVKKKLKSNLINSISNPIFDLVTNDIWRNTTNKIWTPVLITVAQDLINNSLN